MAHGEESAAGGGVIDYAHHCDLCGAGAHRLELYHAHGLCLRCYTILVNVKYDAELFQAILNAAAASRRESPE